jgi:hypothetical protein
MFRNLLTPVVSHFAAGQRPTTPAPPLPLPQPPAPLDAPPVASFRATLARLASDGEGLLAQLAVSERRADELQTALNETRRQCETAVSAARAAADEEAALRRAALARLAQSESQSQTGSGVLRDPLRGALAESEEVAVSALRRLPAEELQELYDRLGLARDRVNAALVAARVAEAVREPCAICTEQPMDIAFACGHRACQLCAPKLMLCHICRVPISSRLRVY